MNVLIQNSLWMSVPTSKLEAYGQVKGLAGDKQKWSESQITLIGKVKNQIDAMADSIIAHL
jgi:hypothetical protein